MAGKVSRLYRLLRLIYLMQGKARLNPAALAEAIGVTPRTLYRDLNQLELAGVPFYFDEASGGYRISSTYYLPSVQLSFDEALAVLSLDSQVKTHPAPEALHSGLLKIINALPAGIRNEAREVLPRIGYHSHPRRMGEDREYYTQLVEAFRRQVKLKVRYHSAREDKTFDTLLSPYSIFFYRHSWYVLGHSTRDKGLRTFKLARFHAMSSTNMRYTVPQDFDREHVLGGAWGIIPEGAIREVRIRFSAKAARYVRETMWHPSQRIEELDGGECRLHARVRGLDELISWVLSWGSQATVESPNALRNAVVQETSLLGQRYTASEYIAGNNQ